MVERYTKNDEESDFFWFDVLLVSQRMAQMRSLSSAPLAVFGIRHDFGSNRIKSVHIPWIFQRCSDISALWRDRLTELDRHGDSVFPIVFSSPIFSNFIHFLHLLEFSRSGGRMEKTNLLIFLDRVRLARLGSPRVHQVVPGLGHRFVTSKVRRGSFAWTGPEVKCISFGEFL